MISYWGIDHGGDEVAKMSPRSAANLVGAHAGARWTTKLSHVADRAEPYAPKHAYTGKRRKPSKFLTKGGAVVTTARNKAAEVTRSVSYDVTGITDREKMIRDAAAGTGRLR